MTTRVIRTTCDVLGSCGDQKNGCPTDWTTFCENFQIPSFKVNRFNCFFHAAAALIHHHREINKLFSSGILPDNINLKLQSVSLDVADERVLCLLCAVALFYVKVTGPYWWLINSSVKYCDFYLHVQRMHSCFQKWTEDSSDLMNPSLKSVFGEEVSFQCTKMTAVQDFLNEDIFLLYF